MTVRRLSSPGWPKGWCLSWGVRCAACAVLVTAAGCGGGRAESHTAAARAPAPMYVHCGGGKRLDAGRLVGLTLARARGLVRCNGCALRVAQIDGRFLPQEANAPSDRINVVVREGKIVGIKGIY